MDMCVCVCVRLPCAYGIWLFNEFIGRLGRRQKNPKYSDGPLKGVASNEITICVLCIAHERNCRLFRISKKKRMKIRFGYYMLRVNAHLASVASAFSIYHLWNLSTPIYIAIYNVPGPYTHTHARIVMVNLCLFSLTHLYDTDTSLHFGDVVSPHTLLKYRM